MNPWRGRAHVKHTSRTFRCISAILPIFSQTYHLLNEGLFSDWKDALYKLKEENVTTEPVQPSRVERVGWRDYTSMWHPLFTLTSIYSAAGELSLRQVQIERRICMDDKWIICI